MNRTSIAAKLNLIEDIIKFRVYRHEYHNAYVETAVNEEAARDMIIGQSNTALTSIKMQYRSPINRKVINITPDSVFAKKLTHTLL